nr:hypothetical protein [Blunervirus sp.]
MPLQRSRRLWKQSPGTAVAIICPVDCVRLSGVWQTPLKTRFSQMNVPLPRRYSDHRVFKYLSTRRFLPACGLFFSVFTGNVFLTPD